MLLNQHTVYMFIIVNIKTSLNDLLSHLKSRIYICKSETDLMKQAVDLHFCITEAGIEVYLLLSYINLPEKKTILHLG